MATTSPRLPPTGDSQELVAAFYDHLSAVTHTLLGCRDAVQPASRPFLDILVRDAPARWDAQEAVHQRAAAADPANYRRHAERVLSIAQRLATGAAAPGPVALAADWLLTAPQRVLLSLDESWPPPTPAASD